MKSDRSLSKTPCVICGVKAVARGYCSKHYDRWKTHGDPETVTVVRTRTADGAPIPCSVEGCGENSRSRGMCAVHYRRQRHTGTTDYTGKKNEGASKHPLYQAWCSLRRPGRVISSEWATFDQFSMSMELAPAPRSWLIRKDLSLPWGPSNCTWRAPKADSKRKKGVWQREASRVYHTKNRDAFKNRALIAKYGITLDTFRAMSTAQGDRCWICTGVNVGGRDLAVDHCHETGAVRGLLCGHCNTALGMFKDQPNLLRKAAAYLEGARSRKAA